MWAELQGQALSVVNAVVAAVAVDILTSSSLCTSLRCCFDDRGNKHKSLALV